jgi:glycosyltransferase involved in cell wall biosynthesis
MVSLISIVIPVFNEQDCLGALMDRLLAIQSATGETFEFIFVDDGSSDNSRNILHQFAAAHTNARTIFFSRNFGHEAATTAGVDHAAGDAVVLIDSDLQDPPEVIPELIAKWREGFQIVYARRRTRKGEGVVKRFTSWLFYRVIRRWAEVDIPPDTGDFRLMDRCVVHQFRRCREQSRFVRGLIAWTGFRQAAVLYDRHERFGGQTKYNLFKLIMLAFDAVIGFSIRPLHMGMVLGLVVMLLAVGISAVVIVQKTVWGIVIPGYAMLASGMFFLGGVQIFLIGLVGEYVGRTYRQAQQRPLYVILEKSDQLPPGPEGLAGKP